MKIILTYIILALISTAINLATQDFVMRFYLGAFNVLFSILVGTAAGLLIKYRLDKRYIFRFQTYSLHHNARTFVLYTAMGMATTMVFWGTELTFHYLFHTSEMRYIGGLVGLAIGYLTKYRLDKRFVFRSSAM